MTRKVHQLQTIFLKKLTGPNTPQDSQLLCNQEPPCAPPAATARLSAHRPFLFPRPTSQATSPARPSLIFPPHLTQSLGKPLGPSQSGPSLSDVVSGKAAYLAFTEFICSTPPPRPAPMGRHHTHSPYSPERWHLQDMIIHHLMNERIITPPNIYMRPTTTFDVFIHLIHMTIF